MVLGAIIGAGASLIGGAINRRESRRADTKNRPSAQVAEWEAAGINPLFGISSGGFIPHQVSTSFGDSFAQAGGSIGRAMSLEHEQELRETNLELQNEELRERIDLLAKDNQPGHLHQHGAILPLPKYGENIASSKGNRNDLSGVASSDVPSGDRVRSIGPGRKFEAQPVSSSAGFTEIDNAITGPILVPGNDGEPMGIDELITLGIAIPFNVAYNVGGAIGDAVDLYEAKRKFDRMYHQVKRNKNAPPGWAGTLPRAIAPTQREIDYHTFRRNVMRIN